MDKDQEELCPRWHSDHNGRFCTSQFLDHWEDYRDNARQERTGATGPDQDPHQPSLQTCDKDLPSSGVDGVVKASLLFHGFGLYWLLPDMTFFRDFGLTLLWGWFGSRRMKTCNGHMNYELSPCAQKNRKKIPKTVKNRKKRKLELYCFSIMNLCVGNYYYCVITCNN